ncbi:unnamed protein product, partial [Musa hybrid cultivar]
MHRGKNRSRKPVEMSLADNLSTTAQPPSSFSSTTTKSSTSNTPCHHHPYHLPVPAPEVSSFLTCPSSKSQHNTPTYNSADNAYRYQHGMKSVDEHFSEAAGGERKNSSRFRPLGMNSLVGKGHMAFVPQQSTSSHSRIDLPREEKPQHCFVLGTDLKLEKPATVEAKQKPLLHFLDERPTTSNTLCLDSKADHSKTQLSISIPVAYHDFPAFKSGFNRAKTAPSGHSATFGCFQCPAQAWIVKGGRRQIGKHRGSPDSPSSSSVFSLFSLNAFSSLVVARLIPPSTGGIIRSLQESFEETLDYHMGKDHHFEEVGESRRRVGGRDRRSSIIALHFLQLPSFENEDTPQRHLQPGGDASKRQPDLFPIIKLRLPSARRHRVSALVVSVLHQIRRRAQGGNPRGPARHAVEVPVQLLRQRTVRGRSRRRRGGRRSEGHGHGGDLGEEEERKEQGHG